ncbi:retrotrans_gag domain-containing protein [Trichonephila clavipes]|nr:retrotrans_gag domain-containing protein [Trichonephila clavipes]
MPTEQAKLAVVAPSLQQWRSPSTFRGAPGEDPLKWLKGYDRLANFNKWDDMMCLANVYFFLDGTVRQRNCTVLHTRCIRTLPKVNPLMKEDEKVSHLMKGVAEILSGLLTREINDTASFIKWCNYIEDKAIHGDHAPASVYDLSNYHERIKRLYGTFADKI